MQITGFDIVGPLLMVPKKQGDQRGFFSEIFRADVLAEHGVVTSFVQDNHVYSAQKGVLRGLHFQLPPHAQGKLLRCTRGSILDIGVDIRVGSPTYGQHIAVELSAANWHHLWIPPGFAHGYITLVEDCEVIYKVTDYYNPDYERGIAWDDPAIAIDWQLPASDIILSDRDRRHPRLAEAPAAFQL